MVGRMNGDSSTFDTISPVYDWLRPSVTPEVIASGLAFAERPIERLLDTGGGSGRGAEATNAPERIVVDPAPGMLHAAAQRGLATTQAAAETLPFADNSADAVLFVYALHHVDAPNQAITEAARVLRPGGVVVIREFDPTGRFGRTMFALGRIVGLHSQPLTSESVVVMLKSSGFAPSVLEGRFRFTAVGVVERNGDLSDEEGQNETVGGGILIQDE
jgi:ubiquinone/menaquinone biosynthesis C-methylase UbiE